MEFLARSTTKMIPFKLLFESKSPAKTDQATAGLLVLKRLVESHANIVSPTLKGLEDRSIAPFRFPRGNDTIGTLWYDKMVDVFGIGQILECHIGKGKTLHVQDRVI